MLEFLEVTVRRPRERQFLPHRIQPFRDILAGNNVSDRLDSDDNGLGHAGEVLKFALRNRA